MTSQVRVQPRPVTPRIALLYAAGDVGTAVTSVSLAFYWLYFLIEAARLPPLVAGLVHGSGYVVSAGANLWAGALLDRRLPDPRARCRLVAGLGVLLAVAFAAMWALPPAPWRIAWYLAVSWVFHLIFALVYLAYLSLSARLGSSDAERVDLNSYRFGGTMLLTLVVLGLHRFTEGRLPLETRLQVLALAVAGLGALGALACGWGLRGQVGAAPERPVAFAGWRAVLATPGLGRAVVANLAVWFMVQAALVLTAFLCAAARASDALVLLALQVATILAAGLTSTVSRRWGAGRLFAASAVLWCVGAGLWQAGWAPYPAAVALGLGLGFGTVLSWARVAEVLAGEAGRGLEGRAYAGLSLSRDLVAAGVPLLAALLMNGHAVGSPASGLAAGAGLLAAALAAASAVLAIRRPARTAADAGTAEVPT